MNEFASDPCIILEVREIYPHKDICPFNRGSERCYGSLERDSQFVCNIGTLRLMYQAEHTGVFDIS
jgi:hypothetical protein